jgi:hypothetical protein
MGTGKGKKPMITINQLLESVESALSAAREYARHDGQREEALAEVNHQVALARQTIADLSARLHSGNGTIPAHDPPLLAVDHTTRMAGLPIHVHALATPYLGQHSHIEWDFGDPRGRFSILPGFNAAHVYENPGSYTVTLSVDGVSTRRQVTITPATLNPISKLADAQSDCRNILTVPVVELASTFWPKIQHASIEGGPGGTTLLYTGRDANAGIVSLPDEGNDVVLRGLTFDSAVDRGATRAVGVYQQKALLAVIDCTGLRLESFVKSESGTAGGLLILGCKAPLVDGISGYFAWISCSDAAILGNQVANVTREHVIRMGYCQRVLVAHNDLANLDRRPIDPEDFAKGCIVAQRGSHVWISANRCHAGGIGIGPLGGSDGLSDKSGSTRFAVVEHNTLEGGKAIEVKNGTEHARVEENTVDRGKSALSAIEVEGIDPLYPDRRSRDLMILDNRQLHGEGSDATVPVVRIGKGVLDVYQEENVAVMMGEKTR